jgi:hypothetical protein
MDNVEATGILREHLQLWREKSWVDLRKELGQTHHFEVTGESGTQYQVEVEAFWDDRPEGAIRVIASIDDGGWRSFVPLTADFARAPDGTFVGE